MKFFFVLVKQSHDDAWVVLQRLSNESHAWHVWAHETTEWDNAIVTTAEMIHRTAIKLKHNSFIAIRLPE